MLVVILLLIISYPAFAAPQLNAIVDTNKVMLGDTFALTLELSDANPIGKPDPSALEDKFIVHSQQQSHSTQIINGKVSSQIVWQYYLETKITGTLLIPAFKLETDVGYLQSKPIKMVVTSNSTKRSDDIRLETTVSNSSPYLHEPIIYTLRLYYKGELRELKPIPPSNDVIMEQLQNDIVPQRKIVNGQEVIIAQMTYLLTPLRSGKLKLNVGKMQGLKQNDTRNRNFFSFNNYRQVTINSSPITLEVKSPETSQSWLPLQNLTLIQNWESDITKSVTVGTPLVLSLKLTAEGMGGQAPPKIENFFQDTTDFKVRSPKPEIERTFLPNKKIPASTITSSFSIIPTNIGELKLPTIRIPWWNLQKQELTWAELPAQTIQVIASTNNIVTNNIPTKVIQQQIVIQQLAFTNTQYAFLIFSIFALLVALWQSWYSRHHIVIPKIKVGMSNSVFKRRLMVLEESTEIKLLIQEYAHLHWQIPKNSSLQTIAKQLPMSHQLNKLFNELNAAMYGKQNFNLLDWKQHCIELFLQLKTEKTSQAEEIVFNPLNPT
ncbi:MAG: BatD family protein [Proteobacteria bacterium]|nr:BatD family protein [Pseudomonadota bacterium]